MDRKHGKFDGKFYDMQFIVRVLDCLKIKCIKHCEWDAVNELQIDIMYCKLKYTMAEGKRIIEDTLEKYDRYLKRYNIKFTEIEARGFDYTTKRYKEVI